MHGQTATPIIARPVAPPAPAPRVLDRDVLPTGIARTAAAAARARAGAERCRAGEPRAQRVVDVPERLVALLLGAPYHAVRRAGDLGVAAELEAQAYHGATMRELLLEPPDRGLKLEGPEELVNSAADLIMGMLWDIHKRHGIPIKALEAKPPELAHYATGDGGGAVRVGWRAAVTGPVCTLSADELTDPIRVLLEGDEEAVYVDKDRGPIWFKGGGGVSFGPSNTGRWHGKAWQGMSTTEREVCLITAARRQKLFRQQRENW